MKYKRQLMSGMFALALLASGTSVFAADIPTTGSKTVQHTNQVKMKSSSSDGVIDAKDKNGKDIETKDDTTKKVIKKKHKKTSKVHVQFTAVPTSTTTTKPLQ
jgi:hypothetical protein